MLLTFYKEGVECGFPSPARDFTESSIDLNEELIHRPNSTFVVRARGHSMIDAGISPGDLIIVDRSLKPRHGSVIVAVLDGELSIKILNIKSKNDLMLSGHTHNGQIFPFNFFVLLPLFAQMHLHISLSNF